MKNVLDGRKASRPAFDEAAAIKANSGTLAFSLISIGATIAILTALTYIDTFSGKTILFMQGCAGLCAILSIISGAVVLYKVNAAYWQDRLRQ